MLLGDAHLYGCSSNEKFDHNMGRKKQEGAWCNIVSPTERKALEPTR